MTDEYREMVRRLFAAGEADAEVDRTPDRARVPAKPDGSDDDLRRFTRHLFNTPNKETNQ